MIGREQLPTCQDIVDVVTDYLEGGMSPDERQRFELHLAFCEACRTFLEQMRETIRLTGMLRVGDLPEGARRTIVDAFRGWSQ